jgi:hypothetical protein
VIEAEVRWTNENEKKLILVSKKLFIGKNAGIKDQGLESVIEIDGKIIPLSGLPFRFQIKE